MKVVLAGLLAVCALLVGSAAAQAPAQESPVSLKYNFSYKVGG